MTFQEFQAMNKKRCDAVFPCREWPVQNWALALCGEAGELANIIKKVLRGDRTLEEARADILKEVADVICYADLLCSEMKADTGKVVLDKFDEVSKRMGYER